MEILIILGILVGGMWFVSTFVEQSHDTPLIIKIIGPIGFLFLLGALFQNF